MHYSTTLYEFCSFSQNGYLKQTLVNDDTTTKYLSEQIHWKLLQRLYDAILESKLNGYVKEYVVLGRDMETFIIRFHTRDNTVIYVYRNEIIIYRGEHISFRL